MKSTKILVIVICLAAAQAASAQAKKMSPAKMSCADYVAVDEQYRPALVYWVAGVDKLGVKETDSMVIDTAQPVGETVADNLVLLKTAFFATALRETGDDGCTCGLLRPCRRPFAGDFEWPRRVGQCSGQVISDRQIGSFTVCFTSRQRATDNPKSSANARGCTSRQHNTHITESRVVLYRWHPWYGRTVRIFNTVEKNAEIVLRCALNPLETAHVSEVPLWMFDADFGDGDQPFR